ncbi:MAG TPA: class I adenylate-forming enzyme family protein [Caulobacterales bacterium]|nr:class I adenylate-forming enzyme family protein [Caulobacterales bacterium]
MGQQRDLTLAGAVRASVAARGDSPAILLDQREVSFRELAQAAERRARQLLGAGVQSGDRVGVLLPNCIEYLEIMLGAAMVGAVTVPMNVRYKSRELKHLIVDSGMSVLYTRKAIDGVVAFGPLLEEALPGLADVKDPSRLDLSVAPRLRAIIAPDASYPRFLAEDRVPLFRGDLPKPPTPEQTLLLMYTSGTTANPKGCIISNRAMMSNAWAIVDRFSLTEKDVWWCPLPMFHIGGILFVMMMLAIGGLYAGMSHFDADKAIDMLERHPPTIFYPLFPTITLPIVDHPRFASLDHSRMRLMVNLAPTDLQRKVQSRVPHAPLCAAFGMTETAGTVAYGKPDDIPEARFQTCGHPLEGWQVKIVDPQTHEPVPIGQRGEIAVRGVGLFDGYFNEPELTRRQHLPDGFFLTGDTGSMDSEGRFSFHGRFKDQLKVGGENVSALEVESFLSTHPAVSLAQVVGIPDEKYGEVPAAFIELRAGASATEREIIDFCTNKIARFKIPRYVRFVSEWPMSATKIVKYRLRERLEAELASDADAAARS